MKLILNNSTMFDVEHKGFIFSVTAQKACEGTAQRVIVEPSGGSFVDLRADGSFIPDYKKEAQARLEVHKQVIDMIKK